jgi:hypothetical protein
MIEQLNKMLIEEKIKNINEVIDMLRNLTIDDLRSEDLKKSMSELKDLLIDYNKVFERLRI